MDEKKNSIFVRRNKKKKMTEESQMCLEMTDENMEKTITHLQQEFAKIRAGKASPSMLDGVKVDNYGSIVPLNQVGNVNTPDARLLVVQPWDKSMLEKIEKAIMNANLGFNPMNDGTVIRIPIPPLTEERRRNLAKQAKTEAENTKITIRSHRRVSNDEAKTLEKDGVPEDECKLLMDKIQEITNKYIVKVDELYGIKEKEIMTV